MFSERNAMSDDTGWIEWKGGECPVADGTMLDLRWDNDPEDKSFFSTYGRYVVAECVAQWDRVTHYRIDDAPQAHMMSAPVEPMSSRSWKRGMA